MNSHSRIPLAGVVGWPVSHSRSPALHGHWLRRYDIPGHYVPLAIAADDLAEALRAMPKLGFVGANVTIPHKEAVLELAHQVSDRASAIGAANTLVFGPDGRIEADNTDGFGFIANLQQSLPSWNAADGPAAVLGAGGAARAIVVALLEAGVPELRIANRTRMRAETLRECFGPRVIVSDWDDVGDMLDGATTVVNTTSLGMSGQAEFSLSLDGMTQGALATDIVYTPLRTGFLIAAEARGARIVDGLGMLLHQAAPGFERWFGRRPEVDDELRRAVLAI